MEIRKKRKTSNRGSDGVTCQATDVRMESRGYTVERINLDKDPQAVKGLRWQGFRQLPVVITDSLSWSGFRPDKINRLGPAQRAVNG